MAEYRRKIAHVKTSTTVVTVGAHTKIGAGSGDAPVLM